MVGFSSLASSPLGDDGGIVNIELTASNIAAQAPSVANASLTQVHDLTTSDVLLLYLTWQCQKQKPSRLPP